MSSQVSVSLGKRTSSRRQRRGKRAKTASSMTLGRAGKQYGPGYQPGTRRAGVGPELMHYTTGRNLTQFDTDPTSTNPAYYHVTTLNNIAQGDAGDGRKGNKIQLKRITIRGKVEVAANSTDDYALLVNHAHLFRVIVYLDLRPNGAAPSWTEMFDPYPVNDGQLFDYNNPYVCDRFKILKDMWISTSNPFFNYDGTNYHAGGSFKFFKLSIPLDCATWFSDGTNNLAAIQQNNIGMWICSDASTSSRPQMYFDYRSKLRYHDF